MRRSDGNVSYREKESGKVWMEVMEWIMNTKNNLDHNGEGDAVEGPVVCVCRVEVMQVFSEMKIERTPGALDVSLLLIASSREVGIQVMAELCQRVLDWLVMPAEWALSIEVPIFKGNGDIRNCRCYGAVKLLDHEMKVMVRVL